MVFGSESPGGEEKATPKLYLDYKKKLGMLHTPTTRDLHEKI